MDVWQDLDQLYEALIWTALGSFLWTKKAWAQAASIQGIAQR